MRIVADVERCRGAGQCTRTAPEVFDQDEKNGTVVMLVDEPSPQSFTTPSPWQPCCAPTPSSGWKRPEGPMTAADSLRPQGRLATPVCFIGERQEHRQASRSPIMNYTCNVAAVISRA
jgi:ferredoxin